jgi:transposase
MQEGKVLTAQDIKHINSLELQLQNMQKQFEEIKKEKDIYNNEKQKYKEKINELESEVIVLNEKLKIALYRQFCRHAERWIDSSQALLFDCGEGKAPVPEKSNEVTEVKSHTRKKKGRKPIADNIPRIEIPLDISEEDRQCACGHEKKCIGEEIRERLVMIPEQVYVLQYHLKKFACSACEGTAEEDIKPAVIMAKPPENIMPGSIATPWLLASIFTKKYCDYTPFYRLEAAFKRIGVDISRQNMSHWQIKSCEKLEPLFKLMKEHLAEGKLVNMDETPMQVMNEPGRENKTQSRMWLARGGPPGQKVSWYEYAETRKAAHIKGILGNFSGWLQSDGYQAYETAMADITGCTPVGCLAHVRRKFYEANAVTKNNETAAAAALNYIKALYENDNELRKKMENKETGRDEFTETRRKQSTVILENFHSWLETQKAEVLPGSLLGQAVKYTLGQWNSLIHYLDYWETTPDNNAAERAIRPFVMGRKNWVMSGSPKGAKSSCQLYSLIETAKENGLNPYWYLVEIYSRAPYMNDDSDWAVLLPWKITLSKPSPVPVQTGGF